MQQFRCIYKINAVLSGAKKSRLPVNYLLGSYTLSIFPAPGIAVNYSCNCFTVSLGDLKPYNRVLDMSFLINGYEIS